MARLSLFFFSCSSRTSAIFVIFFFPRVWCSLLQPVARHKAIPIYTSVQKSQHVNYHKHLSEVNSLSSYIRSLSISCWSWPNDCLNYRGPTSNKSDYRSGTAQRIYCTAFALTRINLYAHSRLKYNIPRATFWYAVARTWLLSWCVLYFSSICSGMLAGPANMVNVMRS